MAIIVFCTAPDLGSAQQLAHAVVSRRLAACGSFVPGLRSIYRWKGAIEQQEEVQMIFKTDAQHQQALTAFLKNNHPYQIPEIFSLPLCTVDADYAAWLLEALH